MDWIRLFIMAAGLSLTACSTELLTEINPDSSSVTLLSKISSVKPSSASKKVAVNTTSSIWQQLKRQQTFYVPLNSRINKELDSYLVSPAHLYRLAERSEPYIYWIIQQLQQRNLPIELAFLPMVESGFNPNAISSAKATGLWQFIPLTAAEYGLTFNRWYDSRRSLFEATEAALNLLAYLNRQFEGDWLLTLAAYNAGEGRVISAIQFNQAKKLPTHFWALKLPEETMSYVPKLLALIHLFSQSSKYKITLPKLDQQNQLQALKVPIQINLSKVAELSNLPLTTVRTYNAGHLLNLTHPTKGSSIILLPKKSIPAFKEKFKQHYSVNTIPIHFATQTQPHPISSHITLKRYAKITDNEVRYLQKINAKYKTELHRIKQGDSLYAIAKKYRVKLEDLLNWNKILDKNVIKPGMLLTIYTPN